MYKPKTSDLAVKKATGKTWKEWFSILDKASAKEMPHREIARLIHDKYLGVKKSRLAPNVASPDGWWSQMVTVEYERARGLRKVNQNSTGFNVGVHRTFDISLPELFASWRVVAEKNKLKETAVRLNKSIRYNGGKGKPLHVAMFTSKGPRRSRLGFEILKLSKESRVEKERTYWKKQLDKLSKTVQEKQKSK